MAPAGARRPIVLGVDAGGHGLLATSWAADEADRRRLPLLMVRAVPQPGSDRRGLEKRYHEELRSDGRQALDKAAALAGERHPRLELATTLVDGNPGQVLCLASAGAELVVLGSLRLSRAEEFLSSSSVAVPVSAQATCPVVVVREPEHITQDPPYLVVGVDGSPSSAAAVDLAFDLAARRGAALRAVRVRQSQPFGRTDGLLADQEPRRLLTETTAGRSGRYPDVKLTHEVIHGHPVEELAKASEHALAVVVGRRGRGGFTGMRLGSVPHGLLHHAHCPVVTVPRPAAEPRG
ncbi:universal stress protein [Kitasatospora herbaricolor]|uniref:universal stress protein n=1 Tax=Kitasatospora herbaricolor TaxID=68217 RepID=UPI00174DD732|nr:universal stress protein [Kitasatospora herbaricolor]MDQ0312710.1 nucleotide-binding universal stress UspA family protein [Kitasatospora herbaricolor]GGV35266.1 universal stress protein [Kitasatospora herbaricolor]